MVRFNVAELGRRIGGFITRARRSTPEMLDQIPEPPEVPPEGGGGALLPTRGEGAAAPSIGGGFAMENRHGVEEGAFVDEKQWHVHPLRDRGTATKIRIPIASFAVARVGTFDRVEAPHREEDKESDL